MNHVIRPYVNKMNQWSKAAIEYLYEINGDRNQVPKNDRVVQQTDVLNYFCFLKATDSAIRNHDRRSVAVSDLNSIFSEENRNYSHSEIQYEEEDNDLILDDESESEKLP